MKNMNPEPEWFVSNVLVLLCIKCLSGKNVLNEKFCWMNMEWKWLEDVYILYIPLESIKFNVLSLPYRVNVFYEITRKCTTYSHILIHHIRTHIDMNFCCRFSFAMYRNWIVICVCIKTCFFFGWHSENRNFMLLWL